MENNKIKLMEVCGTHTMSIARYGIKEILPDEVELISGPGCPVCVTPQEEIDKTLKIAEKKGVILATFGDMVKVPGSRISLSSLKAQGKDIRIVYSSLDALNLAEENPSKEIVFLGVGFETTSPTVASTIIEAKKRKIKNFYVLSNFKLILPAMIALSKSKNIKIDGFICPGHVSVITGSSIYENFAKRYKKSCVVAGFEEIDIIKGITYLIKQIKQNRHKVEITYKRAVTRNGNKKAKDIIREVFKTADSKWRGLGRIKKSGLKIKSKYKDFDAEYKFKVEIPKPTINKNCLCGEVLQGVKTPFDCKLFKKVCSPENPIGPCMVSNEGTCAAYYKYKS